MGRPRKVVVEEEKESIVEDAIEPTLEEKESLNSEQATEPIKEEIIEENEDISINDSLEVNSSEIEDTEEPKTLENNDNKEYLNFTNESMSNLDADPTEIKKKKIKVKKKNINDVERFNKPDFGLTNAQVDQRFSEGLNNINDNKNTKSIPKIFFSNIFTFFNILMFIIAGFLISVQAFTDLVFLLIVSVNIILGIIQEIRAKNMIDNLRLMSAPVANVIREGVKKEIAVDEVVLDDIILFETGNQICADSILIEGNVEVNESLLTGESDAIIKKPGDVLYSGSFIVSGKCKCRVDKVGEHNYVEKLSSQAKQYKKPKSDLLMSLNLIIKVMTVPVVVLGLSLFFSMTMRGGLTSFNFLDYFNGMGNYMDLRPVIRKTAGAMIGMIPSGLFLTSSIALFIGVIRLSQRNVLVQELYCIEMLARVNCICLDKTGTITDGTMSVKNVIDFNSINGLATKNVVSAMLNALQDTNLTSQALREKFGMGKRIKHIASIPFSSQRKYQAVTFEKYGTYILGAPEFVLKEHFTPYKKDVDKYALMGYRVLCLAHKDGIIVDNKLPDNKPEVVSMILIEDNIRPDAINTIKYFKDSGVLVKVISGDNPLTVSKISQRAGVLNADEYISLDGLSDQEVIKAATRYTVFGRVSPAQKRLLIHTLKESGLTVAMTGDGVNDILALKEADCSIAVASGSDAACNCSHIVLCDSNFDSMPYVVREGRRVINNVTSVASLFLTKTIFSLLLAIQALITGNYPISTNQLFLIDVLAIGLPSVILVYEPNNNPVQGKFLFNVIKKALPGALVILIISLIVFGLKDSLNFDSTTLSTIIVIAATHTCLMVLNKVCKPYNTLRRILFGFCYTIFLIAIFAGPQFFEFRPLVGFSEYYSDSTTIEMITSYPKIDISKDNYYVVDGKVIDLQTDNNIKTPTLSSVLNNNDSKFYYAINNTMIDTLVNIPDLSYDNQGNIYFGGYALVNNLKYNDDFISSIRVDENGYVYSNNEALNIKLKNSSVYYNYSTKYGTSSEDEAIKQFRIMPTIELKNGEYVINGIQSNEKSYKAPVYLTSADSLVVTINPSNLELLINGDPIYATFKDGSLDTEPYKVSLPTITTNADDRNNPGAIYINATRTGKSIFTIYGKTRLFESPKSNEPIKTYSLFMKDSSDKILEIAKVESTSPSFEDAYFYVTLDEESGEYKLSQEIDNFNINDIVNKGFKNLYSINSSLNYENIDINNPITGLSIKVENAKSSYILAQGDNTFDTGAYGSLNNAILAPTITVTKSNNYIINGYYTEYSASSYELNPHKNSDNYLVLGNQVTDFKISTNDISTQTGGIVTQLSISSKILLLLLCLLAGPLMKIFQFAVPWLKSSIKDFLKLLSR